MKKLICALAVFVTANVLAQSNPPDTELVRVVGVGPSQKEAIKDGWRQAIEKVSGIVVLSDKEAKQGSLTKDDIGNYSAGYIAKYNIVDSAIDKSRILNLTMDVWVRSSKLANQKLHVATDSVDVNGQDVSTQYKSYLEERNGADYLINKIVNDFPKNALLLKQEKTEIFVDTYRNAVIRIVADISWNQDYLDSLQEALSSVQDGKEFYDLSCLCWVSKERILIVNKKPGKMFFNEDMYYLRDFKIGKTIERRLTLPPKIIATIYDEKDSPIYKQCFFTQKPFAITQPRNIYEVQGYASSRNVVEIKMRANSKLAEQFTNASRIELTLVPDCS